MNASINRLPQGHWSLRSADAALTMPFGTGDEQAKPHRWRD